MMEQITADDEYSLQYFGFTPEQFFKEFTDVILDEMSAVTQEALNGLSSTSTDVPNKELLLAQVVARHDAWTKRAESALRDVQPTIKDFFTIPKNVLLPTDRMQTGFSEQDVAKLESEVKELEEEFKERVAAMQLMKAELSVLDRLKPLKLKVDEASRAIDQFGDKVQQIKEVEKLAAAFWESKRSMEVELPADDEESDGYDVQWIKFATKTDDGSK